MGVSSSISFSRVLLYRLGLLKSNNIYLLIQWIQLIFDIYAFYVLDKVYMEISIIIDYSKITMPIIINNF